MIFSRRIMSVGMDRIPNDPARSGSSSVFTFANTTSGCWLDASSNTGEKKRHGAHHGAQKSTITMGLSLTVLSKLSFVRLTVVINRFLSGYRAKAMYKNKSSSLLVESRGGAGTDSRSRSRMVEILQW